MVASTPINSLSMEAGNGRYGISLISVEYDFPMPDAKYVRAAEAYFKYATEECKPSLAISILTKAEEFGILVKDPLIYQWAGRTMDTI